MECNVLFGFDGVEARGAHALLELVAHPRERAALLAARVAHCLAADSAVVLHARDEADEILS